MNNLNSENVDGINTKLKKLNMAKSNAVTKSRKKKIVEEASNLSDVVDTKIKSVALSKFVIRKTKRLKSLGKTKDDINSLITEITVSEEDMLTRNKTAMKGFGIDKKFIGLSADDILSKINAIPKDTETDEVTKQTKPSKPSKNTSNFKLNDNSDVDTAEDIEQNNEKIYDYLIKSGETDIANYILNLMTKPNSVVSPKRISEIEKNTDEIKKLSSINKGISQKLDELEESLIDEQDTSVSIPKKLEEQAKIEQITQTVEAEPRMGFLESLLSTIFGGAVMALLMSGSIMPMAIKLLSTGFGWLKKKITKLFNGMISMALKPIKFIIDGIKTAFNKIISKLPNSLIPKFLKPNADIDTKPKKLSTNNVPDDAKSKPKQPKKLSKSISKPKTGILRKMARFAKPIPFLGTALAVGTAVYSAVDGYENADKILGIDIEKLTETAKLASAAGALINDVTFGFVDASDTANKILDYFDESPIKNPSKVDKNITPQKNTKVDKNLSDKNIQIEKVQSDIDFLMKERNDAIENNNYEKVTNLDKNLKLYNDRLNKLYSENNETPINKDAKLMLTDEAYKKTLKSVKTYDAKMNNMLAVNQQPLINNINANGKKSPSAFKLFEDL